MAKLVLLNKFIYYGTILREDDDFLYFLDDRNKEVKIRKEFIAVRED